MQRRNGTWIGLALILSGCGAPLPAAVSNSQALPSAESEPAPILRLVPAAHHAGALREHEATASVLIAFQNPRTSFSSEKIDLGTGKLLPVDDGMGPEGDISFFYDGSRFQVIANAGGGANRTIARAESGKAVGEFAMAPIPLHEGSEVLIKQDQRLYTVRITALRAGSMAFLPSGLGTGTGSVAFSYQLQPS
jgi:hypothetical protein